MKLNCGFWHQTRVFVCLFLFKADDRNEFLNWDIYIPLNLFMVVDSVIYCILLIDGCDCIYISFTDIIYAVFYLCHRGATWTIPPTAIMIVTTLTTVTTTTIIVVIVTVIICSNVQNFFTWNISNMIFHLWILPVCTKCVILPMNWD